MVAWSRNSRVHGTTCAEMMAATALEADCMSLNRAIMALEAFGGGTSFRVTWLVTARVPSLPTRRGEMA